MEIHSQTKNHHTVKQAVIRFPEINLATREAHMLRGYFGNLFREHSPLLHNHYADGRLRYGYPLVQYKVIERVPVLVGFNEGGDLLIELFLKIRQIEIDGKTFPVLSKNISNAVFEINNFSELRSYRFVTLWMALNQKNFTIYVQLDDGQKRTFLNKQLQNNILSFYKGIGYHVPEKIMVKGDFREKTTQFKNKKMLAFEGTFVSNAFLPDYTGIGKSTARGFGTIFMAK